MNNKIFQSYFSTQVGIVCRIIRWSYLNNNPLARLGRVISRNIWHVVLPPNRNGLASVRLPHPHAITLSSRSTIGSNVIIYHCVTFGGKRGHGGGAPIIGNNVIIFPNSVIIGKVKIEDNVIIAAGSVVTSDIPEGKIVAGNPAKIVGEVEVDFRSTE